MPILDPATLPANTQAVFHKMRSCELARGLTLIGGTAIALQIQHRMSEDLDFCSWQDNGKLPTTQIESLTAELQRQGCNVRLVTNPAQESTFRINTGERLTDYARDYLLDGVKLTFFAADKRRHPRRFEFLKSAKILENTGCTFSILHLDALKVMKTVLLEDRVKSRDLFDLLVLMRDHDYTMQDFMSNVALYGDQIRDSEHHRSVLRGITPLDKDDEGLTSLGTLPSMDEIYAWFDLKLQRYETQLHEQKIGNSKSHAAPRG